MIIIGFTGTRDGMSIGQYEAFCNEMNIIGAVAQEIEFHHGDCIGSDMQAHKFMDGSEYCTKIVIHPPTNSHFRAFRNSPKAVILEPKDYLERNEDIVVASEAMIATPFEMAEVLRSGTWAAIRCTRSHDRPLVRIHVDGSKVREEYAHAT